MFGGALYLYLCTEVQYVYSSTIHCLPVVTMYSSTVVLYSYRHLVTTSKASAISFVSICMCPLAGALRQLLSNIQSCLGGDWCNRYGGVCFYGAFCGPVTTTPAVKACRWAWFRQCCSSNESVRHQQGAAVYSTMHGLL